MTILEKIAEIEAEMARTQKNKNTNYHLGTLKAKLSKLKSDLMKDSKGGPKAEAFEVSKSGDARIGLVGFPSVGKSTLMNKLTGQSSEVASYEFTTLTCVPGFFKHNGARFQLLDLPGIIEGAKDGKGRGRQVIATARSCSMILVVLDCLRPLQHKAIILKELEETGIRLNKEPPQITINRVDKGGLSIIRAGKIEDPILDDYAVTAILKEYKVTNAQVHIRDNPTADELIDAVDGNRVYIPGIFVMNKIDALTLEELEIMASIEHNCPVSAHLEWNLDGLIDMIWDYSRLTRIYTKPKGKMPDYSSPVVLRNESVTIEDFCNKLHKTMKSNFRSATVWGSSVKFAPQKCGLHHVLNDEDVVQIIKKI